MSTSWIPPASAWRVLRHGSRVSRFRAFVRLASSKVSFRYSGQTQFQIQSPVFTRCGQNNRCTVRSNSNARYFLFSSRIPRASTTDPIFRLGEGQAFGISYQRFHSSCNNHRRPLQVALADRNIFQMDKAAPPDKGFLWDKRECRKTSNMDCCIHLLAGSYS